MHPPAPGSHEPQRDRGPDDAAAEALRALLASLDDCIDQLHHARVRAEDLLAARQSGRPWLEIVTDEARPLVVERLTTVMGTLARVGGAWRREQARALQAEHVSINRIATLFGVTRQRISALLRERDHDGAHGDREHADTDHGDTGHHGPTPRRPQSSSASMAL